MYAYAGVCRGILLLSENSLSDRLRQRLCDPSSRQRLLAALFVTASGMSCMGEADLFLLDNCVVVEVKPEETGVSGEEGGSWYASWSAW